jgi:hypothetical protein
MSSLVETINRFPPCLVRLVARNGHTGQRLPLHALAQRAGLSYGTVHRLSTKRTWANVPPAIIDAFCRACGVDILHPASKLRYLRRVLSDPAGYKKLAAESGAGCAKNLLKMLQSL